RTDADIVTLDRADEGFGHSIALWAFDRRGSRFQAEVASEAACLVGEVTAAIVGQPLDGDRQAIDRAEAMLDRSEHQITKVLGAGAAGGGEETHGLAITAVEREGDPHPFTVVAADLKAVGARAAVALIDGDASVMSPLDPADMAIEQEAAHLHHSVNPLVIWGLLASGQPLGLWGGGDTAVAVGWPVGRDRLDLRHEFIVWQRRPADPFLRSLAHAFDQTGAGDPNHFRHGLHREPSFGGDGGSRSCFFDPVACSSASLRISASSVFLPSSRCSSRTWLCKAR